MSDADDHTYRGERRRLKAKHIWVESDPQWTKLVERASFTRHATNQGWETSMSACFSTSLAVSNENECQGYDYQEVKDKWMQTRKWFEQSPVAQSPSQLVLSSHFLQFDYADATSWEWIAGRRRAWHSYGIPSKEYTGVKQGQMYGMNQCRCSNELSRLWRLALLQIFNKIAKC